MQTNTSASAESEQQRAHRVCGYSTACSQHQHTNTRKRREYVHTLAHSHTHARTQTHIHTPHTVTPTPHSTHNGMYHITTNKQQQIKRKRTRVPVRKVINKERTECVATRLCAHQVNAAVLSFTFIMHEHTAELTTKTTNRLTLYHTKQNECTEHECVRSNPTHSAPTAWLLDCVLINHDVAELLSLQVHHVFMSTQPSSPHT